MPEHTARVVLNDISIVESSPGYNSSPIHPVPHEALKHMAVPNVADQLAIPAQTTPKRLAMVDEQELQAITHEIVLSKSGRWFALMKETVELRDKVYDKRLDVGINMANHIAQWEHTSGRLLQFLSTAEELIGLLPNSLPKAKNDAIQEKFDRLRTSTAHLERWQVQGKAEWDSLTGREGALADKEEELYTIFKNIVIAPEMTMTDDGSSSGDTLNYERLSTSTSERTDSLIHNYNETVGDLQNLQEYIFNADADHQRHEFQREQALKDGDLLTEKRNRQAYEAYVKSRATTIKEFFETKKKMEDLRHQCQDRELKVEEFQTLAFLDLSGCIDRPASETRQAARALKISGRWNPDTFLMFGGLDKQNRILLWRDKVRRATENEVSKSRSPSKCRDISQELIPPPPMAPPLNMNFAVPLPPPPPLPAHLVVAVPEQAIEDDNASQVDESAIKFLGFQEDSPPERRYSAPNLHDATHRKVRPTTQFLLEEETSKSESGLEVLKRDTEKTTAQSPGWVFPMSPSTKQKFKPNDRSRSVVKTLPTPPIA